MKVFSVILAGGSGTRFWPAGRTARPKQLLRIAGDQTMLRDTLERCGTLCETRHVFVVTNAVQAKGVREECPELGEGQVLVEPLMRNTAAAIALAALHVHRQDPEGVLMILPADHVVRPVDAFAGTMRAAARRAADARVLLTVGIIPTGPATGYGYIDAGEPVAEVEGRSVFAVQSFKEKPDAATAREWIRRGNTYWNSGTFVARCSVLLEAFRDLLPGHAEVMDEISASLEAGEALPSDVYRKFDNVPFDIGIVEKADFVEVIPADFEWDDVGSWLAMGRIHPRDESGNIVRGHHVGIDTRNCIVVNTGPGVIATLGLEDTIVVETGDALLICPKDRSEDVRRIVQKLKDEGLQDLT